MYEIVRRTLCARPELAAELLRRDMFLPEEKAELLRRSGKRNAGPSEMLGSIRFATLLAQGDAQLAAAAVLRNLLAPEELEWVYRLLKFKTPSVALDELTRVVERALEARKAND